MADHDAVARDASSGADFDVQGHRGARGLLPENTTAGFLHALELGVTTLETDVVISRDHEVVLSHEAWFSSDFSATPEGERIKPHAQYAHRLFELDYERISTYDCGLPNRRFPRQRAGRCAKPRLMDMIRAAERFAHEQRRRPPFYNIETKTSPAGDQVLHPEPEAFVRRLIDVVEEEGVLERTTIQSFDPRTLRILRRQRIPVRISFLIARGDYLGLDWDLKILGFTPDIYSPDHRLVDSRLVQSAHDRDIRVIPWTVNRLDEMRKLRALGVDGLITDYPDVARELWR